MRFGDIIGNDDVKCALAGMADSGRVPHAIMFHENEGCGALALALAFFQYLNCKHRSGGDSCGECPSCNQISKLIYPDVHFTFPVAGENPTSENFVAQWRELLRKNPFFLENELYESLKLDKKSTLINVAEAKSIISWLSLSSFSDGYKAVIVFLPEKLNTEAANRLLKIVEEPAEKVLFLLITHAPERVLKTIYSRCQLIRVAPAGRREIAEALPKWADVDAEAAEYAAEFSSGSIGAAIRSLAEKDDNVEMMDIFMKLMDSIVSRDYMSVLEVGETLAGMESREKQKRFCQAAGDCIRKIYMMQIGLPALSGVRPDERRFYDEIFGKCGRTFCGAAISALGKARGMILRNVNQKIVFTNLVNRLYVSFDRK